MGHSRVWTRISRGRFDLQGHRHTGEWFCLHRGLSLTEALNTIIADGRFQPLWIRGPQGGTCSSNCGRSSVIVNHGALEPTKMWCVGRMAGSSMRVPIATYTKAPSRTTE